jgi:hypothetical protein
MMTLILILILILSLSLTLSTTLGLGVFLKLKTLLMDVPHHLHVPCEVSCNHILLVGR